MKKSLFIFKITMLAYNTFIAQLSVIYVMYQCVIFPLCIDKEKTGRNSWKIFIIPFMLKCLIYLSKNRIFIRPQLNLCYAFIINILMNYLPKDCVIDSQMRRGIYLNNKQISSLVRRICGSVYKTRSNIHLCIFLS